MKKIIVLILICFSGFSFSQEKYENYDSKLLGKKFEILISKDDQSKIKFYVSAYSLDSTSKESMLVLEESNLNDFTNYLDTLKVTFTKWKKTAIDNKVQDLDKEISKMKPSFTSAFSYGKWQFDFTTALSSSFNVLKGNISVRIESDALVASSNQYIKSNGFVFVFSSEEEFTQLKNALNLEKAKEFFDKKQKEADLFKK